MLQTATLATDWHERLSLRFNNAEGGTFDMFAKRKLWLKTRRASASWVKPFTCALARTEENDYGR